jgi:hypothetical protein
METQQNFNDALKAAMSGGQVPENLDTGLMAECIKRKGYIAMTDAEFEKAMKLVYERGISAANKVDGRTGYIKGIAERTAHRAETKGQYVTFDQLQKGKADGLSQDMQGSLVRMIKAVATTDVTHSRVTSLSAESTAIFNPEHVFYNLVIGNRINTVTDFTRKFREDSLTAVAAFNPNTGPVAKDHLQASRTNTLEFAGGKEEVGLVAEEMIRKHGFPSELDRQITTTLVAIQRHFNAKFLSQTEITEVSAPGDGIYKLGGVLTRTTDDPKSVGTPINGFTFRHLADLSGSPTADISDAVINGLIEAIFTDAGTQGLRIVTTPGATRAIHALHENTFGGLVPFQLADLLRGAQANQMANTVFFSELSGAIPIPVHADFTVEAGWGLIFNPELMVPNGFTIGGASGPFVVTLARTGLSFNEPVAVFDAMTIEDRHLAARSAWKNAVQ